MQTYICHEKKSEKPRQVSPLVKPPIQSMTLLSKFEELIGGLIQTESNFLKTVSIKTFSESKILKY